MRKILLATISSVSDISEDTPFIPMTAVAGGEGRVKSSAVSKEEGRDSNTAVIFVC